MADEQLIKPRELPAAATVFANDAIMTDDGVTVGKATPVQIVNAGAPVPTEAEAIAGTDNSKRMTPLTTKQVLDSVTAPSVMRAAAWAESDSPPDPGIPGSKSAKSWAEEAERLGSEQADRAEAAAAQASLYDGPWLNDVSAIMSDTSLTYEIGQPGSVAVGEYIRTRADGASFVVDSPSSINNQYITAGGVKLQPYGVDESFPRYGQALVWGFQEYEAPDIGVGSVLIGGYNNYGTSGLDGGGFRNRLPGKRSLRAIIGGYDNEITDGGSGDTYGIACAIVASHHSVIDGPTTHGLIAGGSFLDILSGDYTTNIGGTNNKVSDVRADGVTPVVAGQSTLVGGQGNRMHHANSGIFGASNAVVDGQYSFVAGGNNNKAMGNFDHVSGSDNESRAGGAGGGNRNTIGGGRYNIIDRTTSPIANTIGGGQENEIRGSVNTIGGGEDNHIGTDVSPSDYSFIGGGLDNEIAAISFGNILGGRENVVAAQYGSVLSGRDSRVEASGTYSTAQGYQGVSRHACEMTIGAGQFAARGDAQTSIIVQKIQTTDSTVTAMPTLVMPDDTTWAFDILIVARRTDADGESAGYKISGVIDRNANAASTALVGSLSVTVLAEDAAGWDVTVIANAGSGGPQIRVTGEDSKTIRWVARVTLAEVSG